MGIISKYFSLFSYSIHHPKKGLSLLNELKQSNEHSNQVIKKHSAKSLTLEKCLDIVSQENSFSRKQLTENTSKLEEHFRSYFDKNHNIFEISMNYKLIAAQNNLERLDLKEFLI